MIFTGAGCPSVLNNAVEYMAAVGGVIETNTMPSRDCIGSGEIYGTDLGTLSIEDTIYDKLIMPLGLAASAWR